MTSVGVVTLYWFYPIFFVAYFFSDRFFVRIQILCAFSILIPYSFYLFDNEVVIRFLSTLFALCCFSDILIGLQTRLQNRMAELIIRDPLTNAYNRRHMNSSIQIVIEEIKRGLDSASLLWLDIDHFKMVNDQFGHEVGDQVLIKLVDILHKRQRQVDYVFRAGGEEFVLLLKNTELKQALLLADDLRKHVSEAVWSEEQKITISLGVAQYQLGEFSDEWLKRADDHMYEAKNLGRNRVCPLISELG
jgi:diguanylate cyclase (GGDEF)-like protein